MMENLKFISLLFLLFLLFLLNKRYPSVLSIKRIFTYFYVNYFYKILIISFL